MLVTVNKGDRIELRWFQAKGLGEQSLAGMQLKTVATERSGVGAVTHIRADRLEEPRNVRLWVLLDTGEEVVVHPGAVVAVL